jgi:hypothetical protein
MPPKGGGGMRAGEQLNPYSVRDLEFQNYGQEFSRMVLISLHNIVYIDFPLKG